MGCSASTEGTDDDFDGVTSQGQNNRKRAATLDLGGQGLVVLPTLPKPSQVRTLQLGNNFLTRMPKEMGQWTQLEEVLLASNRLVRIPEGLATLPRLTSLDLSNNPLTRTGGFDTLTSLVKLKRICLSMTALKQLPPPLAKCTKLAFLDVGYNQVIDLGVGDVLKSLTSLTSLSVCYCCLRGPLPTAVQNCTSLTTLTLTGNTGLDLGSSNVFGPLTDTLQVLVLSSCGIRRLPQGVLSLKSLKELNLSSNQYLASIEGIGAMSSLTYLNLSDCGLRAVPPGLHEAKTLQKLDFGGNEPESLSDLGEQLPALNSLSVLGSKWALNQVGDDALWIEISRIKTLSNIEWHLWGEKGGKFTVSPYTTRFPLPLCALHIRNMNGIAVREELFDHDTTAETLITVLKDGYYKVDWGYEQQALSSHLDFLERMQAAAVRCPEFVPLLPKGDQAGIGSNPTAANATTGTTGTPPCPIGDVSNAESAGGGAPDSDGHAPVSNPLLAVHERSSPAGEEMGPTSPLPETINAELLSSDTASTYPSAALTRYIVYLYLQTQTHLDNFLPSGTALLPPIDVATVHYAHMIGSPGTYLADVSAILRGVPLVDVSKAMENHYRRNENAWMDVAETASQLAWDTWVQQKEEETGRVLMPWLQYAGVDYTVYAPLAGAPLSNTEDDEAEGMAPPSGGVAETPMMDLSLVGLVPVDWGTSATQAPMLTDPVARLRQFFVLTQSLTANRLRYEALSLECMMRYAKFLAITTRLKRGTTSFGTPSASRNSSTTKGDLAGFGTALPETRVSPTPAGGGAASSSPAAADKPNTPPPSGCGAETTPIDTVVGLDEDAAGSSGWIHPVPTLGIQLSMSLHRSTPDKYLRDLGLFDLEYEDTMWKVTPEATDLTVGVWRETFDEPLVPQDTRSSRRQSQFPLENHTQRSGVPFEDDAKSTTSTSSASPGGGTKTKKMTTPTSKKKRRRVTITTLSVDQEITIDPEPEPDEAENEDQS